MYYIYYTYHTYINKVHPFLLHNMCVCADVVQPFATDVVLPLSLPGIASNKLVPTQLTVDRHSLHCSMANQCIPWYTPWIQIANTSPWWTDSPKGEKGMGVLPQRLCRNQTNWKPGQLHFNNGNQRRKGGFLSIVTEHQPREQLDHFGTNQAQPPLKLDRPVPTHKS